MSSNCRKMLLACLALGLIFALTAPVFAQKDTLKIDYFSNLNTGNGKDSTLRVTNPGTSGGNLCVNVYVFSPDQQLNECCSCFLSPDGLRTFSVTNDLTSNPLTGRIPHTGVIKMISSPAANGCNAAAVAPVAAIRAWATHLQNAGPGPAVQVTEGESQDATLSAAELASVTTNCAFIQNQGSGSGICSCGTGD
jgi:hypothetical protein